MSTGFQVAIDCADPHRQALFWAAALGYVVESNEEQIRGLIAAGFATEDDAMTFDGGLVWRTAAACFDPEGHHPRLYFQEVEEPRVAKNRLHLDLRFGAERMEEEVERLTTLGATRLWEGQQGPHNWVTMADPEGNEFCVA